MDFHAPENFDTPNTINKATKLSTKEMWRGIERRSKKAKKKRMSWMLEESLLKPTRRIKIFQAQCCAMRCMSLYFCCVFSERQRWEWEKRRGDCCYSRGPQEIVFLFIQLYVTLEVRL